MEDGALQLQLLAQLGGVGQRAIVGQRHAALDVVDHQRLGVGATGAAHGAVAGVADGHLPGGQPFEHVCGEHVVDQAHVLVAGDQAVVVDRDAAALLAPVLQCVQAVVAGGGDVHAVLRVDSEDAALLVELF